MASETTHKTLMILLLALSAGCGLERRSKHDQLVRAEAQYQAIHQLSKVPPSETAHSLDQMALGAAYEAGIMLPTYGVAFGLNTPLMAVNEALQQVVTTLLWWTPLPDWLNDATVDLYERGPSWERIHDLFPEAPGGMSYTRLHTPSPPSKKRGEQP